MVSRRAPEEADESAGRRKDREMPATQAELFEQGNSRLDLLPYFGVKSLPEVVFRHADSHPDVIAHLTTKIRNWQRRVGDTARV